MLEFKGGVSVGFRCLFRLRETYTGVHGAGDSPFTCGKHPGRAVGPPDRPGPCTQCVGENTPKEARGAAARGQGEYVHSGAEEEEDCNVNLATKKLAAPAVYEKRKAIMSIRKICSKYEAYVFNLGIGLGNY